MLGCVVCAHFEFVAVWHGDVDVRHDEYVLLGVAVDHATVGFYLELILELIHINPISKGVQDSAQS